MTQVELEMQEVVMHTVLLRAGLEGEAHAHQSRLKRICGSLTPYSSQCTVHHGSRKKHSHEKHHRGSSKSLKMALNLEKKSMGRCGCHLKTRHGLISRSAVAWERVSDVERSKAG